MSKKIKAILILASSILFATGCLLIAIRVPHWSYNKIKEQHSRQLYDRSIDLSVLLKLKSACNTCFQSDTEAQLISKRLLLLRGFYNSKHNYKDKLTGEKPLYLLRSEKVCLLFYMMMQPEDRNVRQIYDLFIREEIGIVRGKYEDSWCLVLEELRDKYFDIEAESVSLTRFRADSVKFEQYYKEYLQGNKNDNSLDRINEFMDSLFIHRGNYYLENYFTLLMMQPDFNSCLRTSIFEFVKNERISKQIKKEIDDWLSWLYSNSPLTTYNCLLTFFPELFPANPYKIYSNSSRVHFPDSLRTDNILLAKYIHKMEQDSRRVGSCGGYSAPGIYGTYSFHRLQSIHTHLFYDARTFEKLASKKFWGSIPPPCPSSYEVSGINATFGADGRHYGSEPNPEIVQRFIDETLKKLYKKE